MAESIQYILSLKDNVSSGLLSIQGKTVLLDKAVQTLGKKLDGLTKAQREWGKTLESSGKVSDKVTQEYEKFLEAAGGEDAGAGVERQRELQQELKKSLGLLQETRKETENLNRAEKEENSLTQKANEKQNGSEKWQLLEKLGRTGMFKLGTDAVGNATTTYLNSALGEQNGAMISGVISGVASGIAMGAAAGPIGMLVGGGIGIFSGLLNGVTKNFEKKDDAFKEYYADLHDTVRANTTESLSRGKTLAASKETEAAAGEAERLRQEGATEEEITAVLTGTYQAAWDRLEESKSIADTAYGTGYNEKRKAGIEAEQAAYDGELGAALSAVLLGEETTVYDQETANALREMGAQYAALSEVHDSGDSTEEEKAEAGLKMQSLKEQAEAMAKAAYESSEQYQLVVETEQEQIAAIRENTKALDGWRNSMILKEEKSEGQGIDGLLPDRDPEGPGSTWGWNSDDWKVTTSDGSDAFGLKWVPYDGYLAMLHQGERVLTAEVVWELCA